MKVLLASALMGLALTVSATSSAQAPAGATGECKDGTYTTSESKKGACAGHGGVKDWHPGTAAAKSAPAAKTAPAATAASTSTKAPATAAAAAATTAPTSAKAPATAAAPATSAPAAKTATNPVSGAPAPGGRPGQVWVNTNSKVYHCPGDKYYGKTKQGEYMTESAAKAAGNHADHGKACS
jgi:hypothetical protein